MAKMQSQLQKQVNQIKGDTNMQLERIDQKSISTRTKISDIKSTIKKMENTLENNGILIEQAE